MQSKDNIQKLKNLFNIFIRPFSLSFFFISLFLYLFKSYIIFFNTKFILSIGIFLGFLSFFLWFKKLNEQNIIKKIIINFCNSTFLISYCIFISDKLNLLPQNLGNAAINFIGGGSLMVGYTIIKNKIDILDIKNINIPKIKNIPPENDFSKKFPKINKIPIIKFLGKLIYKEGYIYSSILILCTLSFLTFGLLHLGKFMSVDEPKWVITRVPQLFTAIYEHNWENTYINDKPGLLPAFLSGAVNLFLDHQTFQQDPIHYEQYLFFWRLPILITNFFLLFVIYNFIKKLFNKNISILTTGLIALNPILIGISQVVNPDSLLWSFGFLSFITFLLYSKTQTNRYIYYSGVFLGFALLSKYFASILYVVFFFHVYIEYLINKIDYLELNKKILGLGKIVLTSIITFTLFFPATWTNFQFITQGTVGSHILEPGFKIILPISLLVLGDILIFNSKISKIIQEKIKIKTIFIYIMSSFFLIISIFLILNTFTNNKFFNFNNFILENFTRGKLNLVKTTLASIYTTLLTLTYPLLFGIILVILIPIKKIQKRLTDENICVIVSIFITAIAFLFGSSLGGYIALARYQILLYPLFSLLSAILFFSIFNNRHNNIAYFFISISFISIIFTFPFYYHYTNSLNTKNYIITEAWGYGGYELAQKLNKIENAKNLTIWSDREGFNEFFIGNSYWKSNTNPFDKNLNIDFLILSSGGEKIFQDGFKRYKENDRRTIYSKVAGETNILDYYKKNSDLKVCIDNNPNNCIRAIRF